MSNKKRTIAALLALVTLAGFGEVKVIRSIRSRMRNRERR